MLQLQNKRAIITSGSDGIGFGIAKAFVEQGADVVIIARDEKKLAQAKATLSSMTTGVVMTLAADLSETAKLANITKQITDLWSEIDILVNNAGTAQFSAFEQVTHNELDRLINLKGTSKNP